MDSSIKNCIINVSIGGWYPKGAARLERSLNYHGFNGDFLSWDKWPNKKFPKSDIYAIKCAAFYEAIKKGYTHILWLDSSVFAINDPNKLFDIINEDGYYFWKTGFNCRQESSDKCIDYFGVHPDTAWEWSGCSGSMMGVNMGNPLAQQFIEQWFQSCKDGIFVGSREHDNQSEDPRFLFHRQDQACASIILNKLEMKIHEPGVYSSYYEPKMNDSVIFAMRGM
jgi:hypothetical protein